MKHLLALLFLLPCLFAGAQTFTLLSPDGRIMVNVSLTGNIMYSVSLGGKEIVLPSPLSLKVGEEILGLEPRLKRSFNRFVEEEHFPVVKQKSDVVEDVYNELVMQFRGDYSLLFRAYDDGVAWRWQTSRKDSLTVQGEEVTLRFPEDHNVYFPKEESMFSHQERLYLHLPLSAIVPPMFSSIPALVDRSDGIKVAITEADLRDYPGMYLTASMNHPWELLGLFPAYPLQEEMTSDRDVKVTERAGYIARTTGNRSFPWRVMVITEKDGDLVESQMVYKLSAPAPDLDFSWVRPGKVAWDWWNANNISGVDFRSGINTETYKYYIDFAADSQIEYVILDEGWYELGDLTRINPKVDMVELLEYAEKKNVGIILWVVWKTLWDQMEVLDRFEKWGVKGIKVDFMQRDDQWMVNYYWKIAEEAAKRHLLVDFHGSYKPAGLHRTWPNVITREGVRGLEWSKWSDGASPENALTLPFVRMVAGPMDYTPGAMINASREQFRPVFDKPMSQGTRCQQMAMYIVFESPLQMLADSPSRYLDEPECMEFLGPVPTVWDETIVLDAQVSDYIVVARRYGDAWYLGGMTDWDARDLSVDLSFLGEGKYDAVVWKDGANAGKNAEDYKKEKLTMGPEDILEIHLAPGGGFVVTLFPQ